MLWSIGDGALDLDDLREALDESPDDAGGRRFAAWISDESSERFGEVSIWDSIEDSEASPPRLRDMIGRDPELWEHFDLEAWAGRL